MRVLAIGLVFALLLSGCVVEERTVTTSRIYAVDGDTIRIGAETYRLIGYDTPETYRAECAAEKALGDRATNRLRDLLYAANEATLLVQAERDRYGRGLAILKIAEQDVGPQLVSEGLARPYDGGTRRGWC
jgi:endonuclease YncB( thermonuclease family)